MAESFDPAALTADKAARYAEVAEMIAAVLEGEPDRVARMATVASMLAAEAKGDFEASAIGWSGRADPDGNLYSFLYTGAPLNDWHYSNKDVDTWLDAARRVHA